MPTQCKACPWRVGVVPSRDIPGGYCAKKHRRLESTIAEPGVIVGGSLKVMACHESPIGKERECVGWLVNQLGPGNNIKLRLSAMDGRYKNIRTVGPQHATLADTLGPPRRK